MILKCIGGPMDGAVYMFANPTGQKLERSTSIKPSGLWFDSKDEHGRNVQNQYKFDGHIFRGDGVCILYKYDGQVVETGIEFETGEGR